jgi:tetratricopeptide (TPR) repeat protein
MTIKNLLCFAAVNFGVVYSVPATGSVEDAITEIATQSRHLADAGKWDDARTVLENNLSELKDVTQIARIKAELAHYAVERNTYFQKDDGLARSKIEDARLAAQAADSKQAFATLETAEGQLTYWNALEGTNEWGPPTSHFDRAIQLYHELGDDVGLGEATFYRGLVYQMQNQNEPARKVFDQALKLTQETGDERIRSFVARHIGYLQESAEAIDYAEQAIELAQSGNSPPALYSAHLTLAKLYFENGKTTEARQLAEQSRAEAEAFGSAEDAKEAEDFLQKHP